ncbi:MAG: vitamin B12-dependent ribonucleotide reductase [Bdellovibrio sp.]|nr:vitamin B12-dependent ribonucleotide reductase [Bdellovibrio sp.]
MSQKKPPQKPLFQSYFVSKNKKAASYFKWKKVDALIKGQDGHVYYENKNIKAPVSWSSNAIDIAASKYFRKTVRAENSIESLIERIGKGFASAAKVSGLFKSTSEIAAFVEELKFIMYSQKAAFNSPVWFNLGLHEAYGVSSNSEHYAYNFKTKKIETLRDAYLRPQISACFIQSIDDSIEGIFDLVKNEAKLFKYGSGTGTNFSNLRSKYEHLSTGGTSSGLISFLEVLDRSAGAIKSGGTTRRAAKMVCLDLDHPEIEDFISWKMKEEKKAQALIAAGYSSDLDGEAFKTVAGQNANNSVRVTDGFMKALAAGGSWSLRKKDGKVFKKLDAKKLWDQLAEAAWTCADPGVQFDDAINQMHTCAKTDKINASNPCSEYMFLDNSACNLASLNLAQFLDAENNFNVAEFIHTARTLFIAQECLVGFASYPTAAIAQNSIDYRPLGLGFANLGSMLMRMGLGYDSDEGRAWAGFITSLMTGVAYRTSAEMAWALGAFNGFKKNKTTMLSVMKKHQGANKNIQWSLLPKAFSKIVNGVWSEVIGSGSKYGFRNAQATVIAPTGTIGIVMDCDTTGIEPDFSLIKYKKLSGGGNLKIINQSLQRGLKSLGYSNVDVENIKEYLIQNETLKGSLVKPEHLSVFSCATGDYYLSPQAHIKMMAAVQPFISGAISKTVNLPNSATVADVESVYREAWQLKLKSVAIYRDGSKFVQPLSGSKDAHDKTKNEFTYPKCSECGSETILESGCYRCLNCGTTTACAS